MENILQKLRAESKNKCTTNLSVLSNIFLVWRRAYAPLGSQQNQKFWSKKVKDIYTRCI